MHPEPNPHPIAVIGVGNEFRRDDGVGFAVVSRLRHDGLREPLPVGTELRTCDGEPTRLIELWEHAHASIVIDAARSGPSTRPGRVRRFVCGGPLPPLTCGSTSSHGLGVAAAIELAHELGRLPATLIVYTVEIEDIGFGIGLSAPARAAVEPVALRVESEVGRLARNYAASRV